MLLKVGRLLVLIIPGGLVVCHTSDGGNSRDFCIRHSQQSHAGADIGCLKHFIPVMRCAGLLNASIMCGEASQVPARLVSCIHCAPQILGKSLGDWDDIYVRFLVPETLDT